MEPADDLILLTLNAILDRGRAALKRRNRERRRAGHRQGGLD